MNKQEADIVVNTKEVQEMIGKYYLNLYTDIEYQVDYINSQQATNSVNEYWVLVGIKSLYQNPGTSRVEQLAFFKNTFRRMTYGDKLRILRNEAKHRIGLYYQAESENDFFSSAFGNSHNEVYVDKRPVTYQNWRLAQAEYIKLAAFISKNGIDLNTAWIQ